MKITWEDRKFGGQIDGQPLAEKPEFSFTYAWFLVTDQIAQYVESHTFGYWNKDMTAEQRQEVVDFYHAWTPPVVPVPVPASVSRRQFMQQLIVEELDDDVAAILDAITDPIERKLKWSWFRDSQVFERHRPELIEVATAMGKTGVDLDEFFKEAATR